MRTFILGTLVALLCMSPSMAADFSEPVKTQEGLVSGVVTAPSGVHVFKGIPFAASAAGEGRWREPAPRAPWTGGLQADHYAPSCFHKPPVPGAPQNNLNIIGAVDTDTPESEDCLYLNLWTPAKTTDAKLPVMVWIYGTGFNYGYLANETFNGVNLAKKGVIVVTIPYRINIFGFFA